MRKNRQWILKERPRGPVSEGCFELTEGEVGEPEDGQVLVRNLMLSFDPTQRGWMTKDTYMPKIPLGSLVLAGGVGQVVESRREGFAPGDLVQGGLGWQDYALTDGQGVMPMTKLPPGTPPNLALGIFGFTGLTGYFGTLEIGRPREGETFVVSAAAGATGSVAGMIAKIQGCRVIGIAGGDRKCNWLRETAGLDETIDYKNEDVEARLGELCPKGIDVYFDNVGGSILEAALDHLAQHARIVLCGAISGYEEHDQPPAPKNYFNLVFAQARMEGFLWMTFMPKVREALGQLSAWHSDGRLKQLEDIQHGLENAPATFMRLFSGANMGKQLLSLAEPE